MLADFTEICAVAADDGVALDIAGMEIDKIREEQEYGGLRSRRWQLWAVRKIRVVVDIGFGDATNRKPKKRYCRSCLIFRRRVSAPTRVSRYCREVSGDGRARTRRTAG